MKNLTIVNLERIVGACHFALGACLFLALISHSGAAVYGVLAVAFFAASVAAGAFSTRAERRLSAPKTALGRTAGGLQ